ncbi:MAG: VOC family protein [Sphingorhabdus sp.]
MAGVQSLGYIVIETTNMTGWESYLTNIVGAMPGGSGEDGAALYRLDNRAARIRVIQSDVDRFAVAGWELADADAFKDMVEELQAAGCEVTMGDAASRNVTAMAHSTDPAGHDFEIFYGAKDANEPFLSPAGVSKFITGELGMGHVVYGTLAFDEALKFYEEVMGFGRSDAPEIEVGPPGTPKMGTCFMHAATGRHHSVALLQMPTPPSGCVHIMIEAAELTDVEAAYARMQEAGVPVSATLGKHTNDQVTSFYMQSPAGFDFEFGWGSMVVDPATWEPTAHTQMDEWGHEWAWQKAAEEAAAEEANN